MNLSGVVCFPTCFASFKQMFGARVRNCSGVELGIAWGRLGVFDIVRNYLWHRLCS
jgi:hypothetical protein